MAFGAVILCFPGEKEQEGNLLSIANHEGAILVSPELWIGRGLGEASHVTALLLSSALGLCF